jgi:hypothetical protein
MQESHGEGLASHTDPESCIDGRKAVDEALTGARAGRAIELRNGNPAIRWGLWGADARHAKRKATSSIPPTQGIAEPHAVGDPAHARNLLDGNRESLEVSATRGRADRIGKSLDVRR